MSSDDFWKKHNEMEKRKEAFSGLSSITPFSKIDQFKKSLCYRITEKHRSQQDMVNAGVCGIVDARKIFAYRYDYLTVDFLLEILCHDKIDEIKLRIFNEVSDNHRAEIKMWLIETYGYDNNDTIVCSLTLEYLLSLYLLQKNSIEVDKILFN